MEQKISKETSTAQNSTNQSKVNYEDQEVIRTQEEIDDIIEADIKALADVFYVHPEEKVYDSAFWNELVDCVSNDGITTEQLIGFNRKHDVLAIYCDYLVDAGDIADWEWDGPNRNYVICKFWSEVKDKYENLDLEEFPDEYTTFDELKSFIDGREEGSEFHISDNCCLYWEDNTLEFSVMYDDIREYCQGDVLKYAHLYKTIDIIEWVIRHLQELAEAAEEMANDEMEDKELERQMNEEMEMRWEAEREEREVYWEKEYERRQAEIEMEWEKRNAEMKDTRNL